MEAATVAPSLSEIVEFLMISWLPEADSASSRLSAAWLCEIVRPSMVMFVLTL